MKICIKCISRASELSCTMQRIASMQFYDNRQNCLVHTRHARRLDRQFFAPKVKNLSCARRAVRMTQIQLQEKNPRNKFLKKAFELAKSKLSLTKKTGSEARNPRARARSTPGSPRRPKSRSPRRSCEE